MYLPTTRISLFISLTNSMKNKLHVKLTGLIWSAYTTTAILDVYSKDITLNSVFLKSSCSFYYYWIIIISNSGYHDVTDSVNKWGWRNVSLHYCMYRTFFLKHVSFLYNLIHHTAFLINYKRFCKQFFLNWNEYAAQFFNHYTWKKHNKKPSPSVVQSWQTSFNVWFSIL